MSDDDCMMMLIYHTSYFNEANVLIVAWTPTQHNTCLITSYLLLRIYVFLSFGTENHSLRVVIHSYMSNRRADLRLQRINYSRQNIRETFERPCAGVRWNGGGFFPSVLPSSFYGAKEHAHKKTTPPPFVPYTFAFVHLARCGWARGEYIEMIDDCLWSEFGGHSIVPYHIVYLIFAHDHSKVRLQSKVRGLQSRPSRSPNLLYI